MYDGLLANIRRKGPKGQVSLTLWPSYEKISHPSPYTMVENPGCTLVLELGMLCAPVMTSNWVGGIIVAFVSESTPSFRSILTQGTCSQNVNQTPHTPSDMTCQLFDTRNHPRRAGQEVNVLLLQPMGYQPAKRRPCTSKSTRLDSCVDGVCRGTHIQGFEYAVVDKVREAHAGQSGNDV